MQEQHSLRLAKQTTDHRPSRKSVNVRSGLLRSLRVRGFTLIELLVVMAIIAILAGLILQTAGYIQRKSATARAEAEIAALSAALESYKTDTGDYPRSASVTNSGAGANSLLGVLHPTNGKVYFEFSKVMTNTLGIVDPFGERYRYAYPGAADRSGSNFFDLWSEAGRSNNEESWVKNW